MGGATNKISQMANGPQVESVRAPRKAEAPSGESPAREISRAGPPPKDVDVERVAQALQAYASQHDISLDISVHQSTGRTVIKVVNVETNEVVREIPPEDILKLMVSLKRMAGHLISTTA